MNKLEAIKRLEWLAWACRSTGSAVLVGDDFECLEMAIDAMRKQEADNDST